MVISMVKGIFRGFKEHIEGQPVILIERDGEIVSLVLSEHEAYQIRKIRQHSLRKDLVIEYFNDEWTIDTLDGKEIIYRKKF